MKQVKRAEVQLQQVAVAAKQVELVEAQLHQVAVSSKQVAVAAKQQLQPMVSQEPVHCFRDLEFSQRPDVQLVDAHMDAHEAAAGAQQPEQQVLLAECLRRYLYIE